MCDCFCGVNNPITAPIIISLVTERWKARSHEIFINPRISNIAGLDQRANSRRRNCVAVELNGSPGASCDDAGDFSQSLLFCAVPAKVRCGFCYLLTYWLSFFLFNLSGFITDYSAIHRCTKINIKKQTSIQHHTSKTVLTLVDTLQMKTDARGKRWSHFHFIHRYIAVAQ